MENKDQLAQQLSEQPGDQDVRLDLDKPENGETPVTIVEDVPAEPSTEAADVTPVEERKKKGEVDPTFNCPDCVGEGMTFNAVFPEGKICSTCQGTGKLS